MITKLTSAEELTEKALSEVKEPGTYTRGVSIFESVQRAILAAQNEALDQTKNDSDRIDRALSNLDDGATSVTIRGHTVTLTKNLINSYDKNKKLDDAKEIMVEAQREVIRDWCDTNKDKIVTMLGDQNGELETENTHLKSLLDTKTRVIDLARQVASIYPCDNYLYGDSCSTSDDAVKNWCLPCAMRRTLFGNPGGELSWVEKQLQDPEVRAMYEKEKAKMEW